VASHQVQDVDPSQAQQLIDAGWRVIDVRTDAEWAHGHLAGSHHVPMDQVVEEIGGHLEHPLLLVCASGGRSLRVARYLAAQGAETANLDGGLHAWEAAGLPIER
jgi:rhodanese-related sulfurtransferase